MTNQILKLHSCTAAGLNLLLLDEPHVCVISLVKDKWFVEVCRMNYLTFELQEASAAIAQPKVYKGRGNLQPNKHC